MKVGFGIAGMRWIVLGVLVGGLMVAGWGQQAVPAGAQVGSQSGVSGGKKTCAVGVWNPNDGDEALERGRFEDAERVYAAMPSSSAATAGVVRAKLGERKLDEALALIEKETAAHPNDALLEDVLGEVRFRRGEVGEAAVAYNRSVVLDPCVGRTHFDMGRYMNLSGLYGSAQRQLDLAHVLSPKDPMITRAYESTHRVPLTPEEQIARLKERETSQTLTDEQKAALENTIKGIEARQKGNCELAAPMTTAKIPLTTLGNVSGTQAWDGAGVDVYFNGKRRRFKLDTGASGLSMSREAAKSLGLTEEARTKGYGIGDEGMRESIVSHVDDLRVGPMEFHNCLVQVFETKNVMQGLDGLIGADVFRSFLVTLDLPAHEMRLSPLPKRPDEVEQAVSLGTDGEDAAGATLAETRKYVAPEMADWTRVFRSGHDLIFPTSIGKAPVKLFVMDTGAGLNLISPEAAREVAHVSGDDNMHVHGISGEVKNVMGTGAISITFARVRQESYGMTAIDMSGMSRSTGVELSGFIGYPTLREMVITIDYRDNLVHVTYTPHIGSSGR
jgi:tetratricopeptide (TPR) repeat protein